MINKNDFILLFLIFLIILLPLSSATSLGVSPDNLKFSGKTNEVICKNFSILGDEKNVLSGEVRWSNKSSRNVNDYTLSSTELKISAIYPAKAKTGKYQICISAEKEGTYYGALLYKLENSSYGIGIWTDLEIKQNPSIKESLSITGGATNENNSFQNYLFFTPVLFIAILIFLLKRLKDKEAKGSSNLTV